MDEKMERNCEMVGKKKKYACVCVCVTRTLLQLN